MKNIVPILITLHEVVFVAVYNQFSAEVCVFDPFVVQSVEPFYVLSFISLSKPLPRFLILFISTGVEHLIYTSPVGVLR